MNTTELKKLKLRIQETASQLRDMMKEYALLAEQLEEEIVATEMFNFTDDERLNQAIMAFDEQIALENFLDESHSKSGIDSDSVREL